MTEKLRPRLTPRSGRETHRRSRRGGFGSAAVAAAALVLPTMASAAANPPTCDPAVYPRAFLAFESVYSKNTRWVQMEERENTGELREQADAEYPFPLTVDPSKSPSSTHMIHSYPRDQVAIRFKRGETAIVTATYVEVHTEYDLIGAHNVRCTRVVRTHYKAPPGRHSRHYHP
jgi:hypothetical protein